MDVVVVLRVITKLQFLLACLVLELGTQYKLDWSDFFLGNFALASTAEKKILTRVYSQWGKDKRKRVKVEFGFLIPFIL